MKKATKRKIHKLVINSITVLCGIVFLLALAGEAKNIWLQVAVLLVTGGWLYLWAWANGWLEWGGEK